MTSFSAKMSSTTVSSKMEADSPPPSLEAGTEDEVESRDEEDESSRSEETLPTFQGQSKLGFSIAQIMGFMGNKSQHQHQPQSTEDDEVKAKEERDDKQPPIGATKEGVSQLPIMPKLWRPQPFREFSASSAPQSQRFVLILNIRRYLLLTK